MPGMHALGPTYADPLLNAMFGDEHTDEFPDTYYVALFTGPDTVMDEVTGGGYARQPLPNNDETFPPATGGLQTVDVEIEWAVAGSTWGTITHVGLMDAETGGQVVTFRRLAEEVLIEAGGQARIAPGLLTWRAWTLNDAITEL